MAKPKAQTMQQKMGFMDSDLGTQKHDEIMLWLDANIEAVIESITGNKAEVENKIWEYPISKLVRAQVVQIRKLYAQGTITQRELAGRFGISRRQICDIINRVCWKHIRG